MVSFHHLDGISKFIVRITLKYEKIRLAKGKVHNKNVAGY